MSAECYNNKEIGHAKSRLGASRCGQIVRFFVAAVLLLAAGLKAYQLATVPSLGEGILHARWFNILVVEFEIFFAFWLLSGLLPKLTWLASIALFSVFTLVSLFKAISGETSCGCFGSVTVNPWITVAFDAGIVGLLVYFRPREEILKKIPISLLTTYFGTSITVGVVVYVWIAQAAFERLEHVGQVLGGSVVQLEPETWDGKVFPLRDYVVGGLELTQGHWTVLLFRPGCGHCDEIKTWLSNQSDKSIARVAFLDIASKTIMSDIDAKVKMYRLAQGVSWVADTPVVLELNDGVVQKVQLRANLRSKIFNGNNSFRLAERDFDSVGLF